MMQKKKNELVFWVCFSASARAYFVAFVLGLEGSGGDGDSESGTKSLKSPKKCKKMKISCVLTFCIKHSQHFGIPLVF